MSELKRLWDAADKVHPGIGPRPLFNKARYVMRARAVTPLVSALLDAPEGSLLEQHVRQRGQVVLGFVEAPYINARWDESARLQAFIRQCALVASMGSVFNFALNESVVLPRIEALGPDYSIVIDKPIWSQREGLLTISVFRGNVRLYSTSFSFDTLDGEKVLLIGGLQGRNIDGALNEYRLLTELAHGLHPRKLLIEILRMVGAEVGVQRILAVSDACRHHRHAFFGKKKIDDLTLDYDEIWRDRDGAEAGDGSFFELPLRRLVRDLDNLEELSPKKRKKRRHQYRLRYPMLDQMEQDIKAALPSLRPEVRPEAE